LRGRMNSARASIVAGDTDINWLLEASIAGQ
jgi:hypothetical protein